MNQAEWTEKPPSPLPAIVVTCIMMGVLAYLMISVAGHTGPAAFIQFGAALATLAYLLTFINIRLGLGILILCVGLSPEVSVAGFDNLRFEDFLVPALLAAWLLRSLRTREEFQPNPIKRPIVVYLTLMLISALLGINADSVKPLTTTLILGKNTIYFLIYLIFLNNVRTYHEFKAFVIFALLTGAAASFISFGAISSMPEGARRVHGPLGETANIFGGYLVMHICVLIGLFLFSPTARGRLFTAIAAGFISYIMLFTYSRTSYVALSASLLCFGALAHRRLIILVLVLAVLFPLVAPDTVIQRAVSILGIFTGPGPESYEARVWSWEDNVDRLFSRPVFGSGPGSIAFGDIDNEYVRVALDLGLLGVMGLLWILLSLLYFAVKLFLRLEGPGFLKGYAAGYVMAIGAILVHACGSTSFSAIRTMEAFMILTALMVALMNNADEWKKDEARELQDVLSGHSDAASFKRF
jgi:hypothetical protein